MDQTSALAIADRIVDLINSQPRTPTSSAIAEIILSGMGATPSPDGAEPVCRDGEHLVGCPTCNDCGARGCEKHAAGCIARVDEGVPADPVQDPIDPNEPLGPRPAAREWLREWLRRDMERGGWDLDRVRESWARINRVPKPHSHEVEYDWRGAEAPEPSDPLTLEGPFRPACRDRGERGHIFDCPVDLLKGKDLSDGTEADWQKSTPEPAAGRVREHAKARRDQEPLRSLGQGDCSSVQRTGRSEAEKVCGRGYGSDSS